MRAQDLERGRAVLADQLADRGLARLEQCDVAIDEPRQRQRERGGLEQPDRLVALGARAVLVDGQLVGEREDLVDLAEVARALGRLELGEQRERRDRRLDRTRLREHAAQLADQGRLRREPGADRERVIAPERAQLEQQLLRDQRLVVLDRLVDAAGERGRHLGAHAVARGAVRQNPKLIDGLVAVGVVAELERRVGKRRARRAGMAACGDRQDRDQRGNSHENKLALPCRCDDVW